MSSPKRELAHANLVRVRARVRVRKRELAHANLARGGVEERVGARAGVR